MTYYHYTNLVRGFKILQDYKIIIGETEKRMAKKPACWFSTNDHFEKSQYAGYENEEGRKFVFTPEEMSKLMGSVRFGFNKLNSFITFAKYKHASKEPIELYESLIKYGEKVGADTKEWYASFQDISLDYCISIEIFIKDKWVEWSEENYYKAVKVAKMIQLNN